MEWIAPGVVIAACGVGIALMAQLGHALHQFQVHVQRQTELGLTVEALSGHVQELREDVNQLENVLRNGLNARLAELKHVVEMHQARCATTVAHVEERLHRVEQKL